ncbi:MAG: hypothetical protein DHS20C21_20050 [Gemmatimonadota bacterium]|nr:MAG: hypothetical protein DHS20C21_20050 [Gemmatimonadota bacterium]
MTAGRCAARVGGRFTAVVLALALAGPLGGCAPQGPPVVHRGNVVLHEDVAQLLDDLVDRVEAEPTNADARGALAMAYDANGLADEAVQTYEQAITLNPADARWYYQSAIVLGELGEYPRAVARLDSTIARDPEYPPSYWRRGQFEFAQGNLDAAEVSFREAQRLRPQHPAGAVGLARVYLQRRDGEAAARLLEDTLQNLKRAQFLPYLHYLLGTAYRQTGRLEEARTELALGRRGSPLWGDPWRGEIEQYQVSLRGRLAATRPFVDAGRGSEVVPTLEQMREEAPDDRGLLDQLSRAYFSSGRIAEAQAVLEHCVSVHPDDERSYRNLSRVHQARRNLPEALRVAAYAVELNPNIAAGHTNYGTILEAAGQRDEALAAYRSALGCDPSHEETLLRCGSLAAALGYWEEAHARFDRLLADDPTHWEALVGRGKAAGALGQLQDGIRDLEAARAVRPEDTSPEAALRALRHQLNGDSSE